MKQLQLVKYLIIIFGVTSCTPNDSKSGYQGQAPIKLVSTTSKPIEKQWKGIWSFQDSTVFFSNDFEGARLNGVAYDSADNFTILIAAENYPINPSPWYAFKVWSSDSRPINITITYQNSRSRYYPKVSSDGINFEPLDSAKYTPIGQGEGEFGIGSVPESISMQIEASPEPIWIAAQELYTSTQIKSWVDAIAENEFATAGILGKSKEGRDMDMLTIGNAIPKKGLIIISRQHPPEVTGFLAMKSFIETISGDSDLAVKFRDQFVTFVVPLMNPDGVDNGHWRHSSGGIDLNRDWQFFNQPETANVKLFLEEKKKEGYDFVFGGDFHSTWDDIYYPLDSTITSGDEDGMLIFDWIERITDRLPQKVTNIDPSQNIETTTVSRNYFYLNHEMPSIVFELGDNTPRDFLEEKGMIAAEELMLLLMNE